MENTIALQKVSEDKKYRLTVHYDECVEHPLNGFFDFPMHMDDWCRDYSANPTMHYRDVSKREHYKSRWACMKDLLADYGDMKAIFDRLVQCGKKTTHNCYDFGLVYDRHRKAWLLMCYCSRYDCETRKNVWGWYEVEEFEGKRGDVDMYALLDCLTDEALADLIGSCLTDKVKVMSYGFDYYGGISFYGNVDADCEGIAWLVKSEAVGDGKWLTEEQWRTMDCYALTRGERQTIQAWANGEVYRFEVEKNVKWKVHRECLSEEREPEDYEEEEWELVDSCCGFYGLDYAVQAAIESNNLQKLIAA